MEAPKQCRGPLGISPSTANQSRSWLEAIQFVLAGSAKRTCWAALMRFHFLRAGRKASHRGHELKSAPPNGSQDCRDILNAVPKRNPMIVPTKPVRKITSACDIWTDQTRYRTSTTVEFCIAKMIPNRSRIPPRISLNLVVMVSWFSLSSWGGHAPHSEGAGFQTHGLRKFEFKAWIISSARVFHKTLCRRAPLESNCLMIPVAGQPSPTLRPVRMLGATPTRAFVGFSLAGIPDSNFAYWPHPTETSVKGPGRTRAESATTGDLGPCFCQMARPCPCQANWESIGRSANRGRVLFPMTGVFLPIRFSSPQRRGTESNEPPSFSLRSCCLLRLGGCSVNGCSASDSPP